MGLPFDDSTLDELAKTNPDLVAQYRAKMQAPTEGLQAARTTQDYGDVANSLGKGLNELGNASKPKDAVLYNRMDQLGKAPTVRGVEDRGYDDKAIGNITGRGVAQAKEDQATAANTFNEEQKLIDTGRGRDWQDKSQGQQQKDWKVTNDNNERNGPGGVGAKQAGLLLKNALLAKATEADEAGKQGVPGASEAAIALREQAKTAGDGMSAGDIVSQQKLINDTSYDKVLEMKTKKSSMDANNAYRQSLQDDKKSKLESNNYVEVANKIENPRGNAAIQQAQKDLYSNDKALGQLDRKDPNTYKKADLRLMAEEMGKIASGGVPGEAGVKDLMPHTAMGTLTDLQSFLGNEPSDAQAAAWVKENQARLQNWKNTANTTLQNYTNRMVQNYQDAGKINADSATKLRKQYKIGDWAEKPADAPAPASAASDPTVDKYAKDHGLTYEQALAIKQARSK